MSNNNMSLEQFRAFVEKEVACHLSFPFATKAQLCGLDGCFPGPPRYHVEVHAPSPKGIDYVFVVEATTEDILLILNNPYLFVRSKIDPQAAALENELKVAWAKITATKEKRESKN